ncbi:MAG: NUDIX hydrolase [Candidatus Taylorbacteria bacterium]|nr:NUDIX hydrolase [Candidatus Taylorbacteria bacterium]
MPPEANAAPDTSQSTQKSKMEIKSQFDHRGKTYKFTYTDGVPEIETNPSILDGVHSYCFYGDKLVIVGHGKDNNWTPPGGAIEKGETYTEAAIREIKEESNMKVLHIECIGYQDIETAGENKIQRQFRMFCVVEPYGDFESDPDGDILEIKLIDPKDYKEYIKWGEIGDHLIKRALEMKSEFVI